jgi:FKBP-type peptidyl-prolyl cis-trans isomerase SlyD
VRIEKGKVVALTYSVFDDEHHIVDSNEGYAPLVYLHGAHNILPGLESGLQGRKSGEPLEIVLDAGTYTAPVEKMHSAPVLSSLQSEEENLPLDRSLKFRIKIISVRQASADEMAYGYPLPNKSSTACCPPGCC